MTNKMWQFTQLPSRFAKGPASMRTELAHLRPASHLVQRDYRRAESAIASLAFQRSGLRMVTAAGRDRRAISADLAPIPVVWQ